VGVKCRLPVSGQLYLGVWHLPKIYEAWEWHAEEQRESPTIARYGGISPPDVPARTGGHKSKQVTPNPNCDSSFWVARWPGCSKLMHRCSKRKESMTSFTLVADTPLRQLTLTLTLTILYGLYLPTVILAIIWWPVGKVFGHQWLSRWLKFRRLESGKTHILQSRSTTVQR